MINSGHPHGQTDYSLRADYAADHDATLAVGRSQALPGQVSLSPHSVRTARQPQRLVLPSPNGSTISSQLTKTVPAVTGASPRNRHAAANWLLVPRERRPTLQMAVIAARERWPDGTLRPAVEDQRAASSTFYAPPDGQASPPRPTQPQTPSVPSPATSVTTLAGYASGRELIDAATPTTSIRLPNSTAAQPSRFSNRTPPSHADSTRSRHYS
ncbi:MAG: hypothetical protein ACRDQ6_13110 [Pseudonocardiaceae bacterium]